MPLAVSDLRVWFILRPAPGPPILVVEISKVCDFVAETTHLFAKHFKVIHSH